MLKGAIKSKTVWFGVALQVFSEVMYYLPQFEDHMSVDAYSLTTKIIGLIIIILRIVTTKPLADK